MFVLRLIQFRAGYNLPVHTAMEMGHFARHDLKLDISYTPGSIYLMNALQAGEFQIGHAAVDDLVAHIEGQTGTPTQVSDLFLFMGIYGGLISLVGSPEHRDVRSLRGKTLAVDARTSGFVLVLERKLRSMGFRRSDYNLVEVGGWESRYRALLEGNYAATLLTPPYVGEALEAGCHLLARADEMIPVYEATCGLARRSWARENADVLARYIRAYVEATRWCFDPKNRKDCLDLLMKYNGINRSSAEDTLDALLDPRNGLHPKAELNLAGITAVLELRAEIGYLMPPVPPAEKYVDLSYYRRAVGYD